MWANRVVYLSLACVFLAAGLAHGDPVIDADGVKDAAGQNDVLRQGEHITITGSGFGTKAQAAPLMWDDFEAGLDGMDLKDWDLARVGGTSPVYPRYSNAVLRAGQSLFSGMMSTLGSQYNCTAHKSMGRKKQAYASLYCYIQRVSEYTSWNIKMFRMCGGYPNYKSGYPRIGVTLGLNCAYNETGSGVNQRWGVASPEGQWVRWEYYLKLSDPPGTPTGAVGLWLDTVEEWRVANIVTMDSDAARDEHGYRSLDSAVLRFYAAKPDAPSRGSGPSQYKIYYDDVYVDDTRARVEVGNASAWAACTKREVQIPIQWTKDVTPGKDEIAVTVNQGSFRYDENAWLFVVDSLGNPSAGHPITFGRSASWLAHVINRWHSGEISEGSRNRAIYWYMYGTEPPDGWQPDLIDLGNAFAVVE